MWSPAKGGACQSGSRGLGRAVSKRVNGRTATVTKRGFPSYKAAAGDGELPNWQTLIVVVRLSEDQIVTRF
jgi:hypothetical protein